MTLKERFEPDFLLIGWAKITGVNWQLNETSADSRRWSCDSPSLTCAAACIKQSQLASELQVGGLCSWLRQLFEGWWQTGVGGKRPPLLMWVVIDTPSAANKHWLMTWHLKSSINQITSGGPRKRRLLMTQWRLSQSILGWIHHPRFNYITHAAL